MASSSLPEESTSTDLAAFASESTKDPISPSQPLPAAHPSHSRGNSKEAAVSPQTSSSSEPTPKAKTTFTRGKSSSLSFPVLANNASNNVPALVEAQASKRAANPLRITVPSANDSSFLTTLAAQERRVLELREELSKAEESLGNLKKQWATHEARRRESESGRSHKMKPINQETPLGPRFSSYAGGATTPKAVFEEMQRRKASTDQAKPSPRRRRFSGSRQIRALSLVSPDALNKLAEQSEATTNHDGQEQLESPALTESPSQMPPTPDLIFEEDEDEGETPTDSQRSSQSPRQRRHMARSSVQMATDFRDGLWTFFEDLKQATYGQEARTANARPRGGSRSDLLARKDPSMRASTGDGRKTQKRTVRRQTWQIRPRDSHETLIDVGGQHFKVPTEQVLQPAEYRPPVPPKSPLAPNPPSKPTTTPQRLYEKEFDGEVWQTWDTPKAGSLASTPIASRSRNSSIDKKDGKGRQPMNGEGKHGPLQWPNLHKLRPGQLTRTVSHLTNEWEKSLGPPLTYQQVQQVQQEDGRHSPRPASPRPVSRKSNSRLDDNYS